MAVLRNGKRALAFFMAVLMFGGLLSVLVPESSLQVSAGEIPATISSTWYVSKYERYDGGTCVITGSLIVQSGGDLILNNLTLAFDVPNDYTYYISVEAGGILRVFNTTIKSNNNYQIYYFQSGGSIQIENSTLRDIGPLDWWTGIYPYAGTAVFKNDTFIDNDIGLYVSGTIPTVEDCIFDSSYTSGIYIETGSPTFRNITITKSVTPWGYMGGVTNWGGGTPVFYDSKITGNNGYGIYVESSSMQFWNSSITGNTGSDIYLANWGGTAAIDMYNSKYGTKTFSGQGGEVIKVYWFVNISADWQSDGSPVDGGTYTIFDKSDTQVTTDVLDSLGEKWWLPVKEYEDKATGGKTFFSPFKFNVTGTRSALTRTGATQLDVKKNSDVSVILDDVPPALAIISPVEDFATNQTSVQVRGNTEPLAKVWVDNLPVTVDGSGAFSTTANVVLDVEGNNNIKVRSIDLVGNERVAEVNVTRDTIGPALTVDEPAEGALLNYTNVLVAGKTEVGAKLKVNFDMVPVQADGKYNVTLVLPEGPNMITLKSTDAVGNTVTRNVNITVDVTKPVLTIGEPVEGFKSRDTAIRVAGVTEPKATLTVNGQLITLSGSMFTATVNLVEGMNTITVRSCDKALNCVLKTVSGSRDSVPPPLTVTSPPTPDEVLTNIDEVYINGTTEPGAKVTIDGKSTDIEADGSFSVLYELTKQGDHTFTIVATDSYGNTAQAVRKFKLDTILPLLEVLTPEDGSRTKEKEVEVTGIVEAGAVLTINDVRVSFIGTTFEKVYPLAVEGQNNFTVKAVDKAGNVAAVTFTVVRDTKVRLDITAPSEGAKTKNETVLVEGFSDPRAEVVVNDLILTAGNDGKFKTRVNLTIGENVFYINVTDDLGNKASGQVMVVREKEPEPPGPIGPGTGGLSGLLPIILLVVVLAAVGGGIGVYMMKRKKKEQEPPAQPPQVQEPQPVQPQTPQQGYYQGGQQYQYPPQYPPQNPPNYPGY